tara:strand:- start:1151 stop:2263 length:1113 start_codon:yes stop_codon:yes gene_type:complete
MALTKVDTSMVESSGAFGRRNILINGDFRVAQRASEITSIGANASTYYTADRWKLDMGGNNSGRVTMNAVVDDAPTESNTTKSLKLTCTTADTSIAAGEYFILLQQIEGVNLQQFKKGTSGAKEYTVSFFVKGNGSATYVVELYDSDNGRQISKTFSVTSSWSKVELTFPADTTGAFGNDTNASLNVSIWLHAGSDYTGGTLNSSAWAAQTPANRAAGISSFMSSTSNTFAITAVQLEVGNVATEFEVLSRGETEKLCHRYYQKYAYGDLASGTSDAGIFNGNMWATTLFYGMFYFPRGETRPAPTLTLSSATDCTVFAGGSTSDTTSADFTDRTSYGCELTLGTNTLTAGRGAWVRFKSGNFLEVDAEL